MEVLCRSLGEWICYVHYQPPWKGSENEHQSTHGIIYAHKLTIWTTFVSGHEHWRWVSERESQGQLPEGKVWQGESWSWGRHIGRRRGHNNQENHFIAGIAGRHMQVSQVLEHLSQICKRSMQSNFSWISYDSPKPMLDCECKGCCGQWHQVPYQSHHTTWRDHVKMPWGLWGMVNVHTSTVMVQVQLE